MAAAAKRENQGGRIISMEPRQTTTCLETFAKEKIRDGAGEQRVPARHRCR